MFGKGRGENKELESSGKNRGRDYRGGYESKEN